MYSVQPWPTSCAWLCMVTKNSFKNRCWWSKIYWWIPYVFQNICSLAETGVDGEPIRVPVYFQFISVLTYSDETSSDKVGFYLKTEILGITSCWSIINSYIAIHHPNSWEEGKARPYNYVTPPFVTNFPVKFSITLHI